MVLNQLEMYLLLISIFGFLILFSVSAANMRDDTMKNITACEGDTITFPWKLPTLDMDTGLTLRHRNFKKQEFVVLRKDVGKMDFALKESNFAITTHDIILHQVSKDNAGIYSFYCTKKITDEIHLHVKDSSECPPKDTFEDFNILVDRDGNAIPLTEETKISIKVPTTLGFLIRVPKASPPINCTIENYRNGIFPQVGMIDQDSYCSTVEAFPEEGVFPVTFKLSFYSRHGSKTAIINATRDFTSGCLTAQGQRTGQRGASQEALHDEVLSRTENQDGISRGELIIIVLLACILLLLMFNTSLPLIRGKNEAQSRPYHWVHHMRETEL